MKINKKLLIPVFATAMGLSVIGGVSGAVAWYQYNTKVTGSWMGVSTADGGVLQIKDGSGNWKRDASYGAATDKLHPITFGKMTASQALPEHAYKHPQAGKEFEAMTSWDSAVASDYVQFNVELRALKLNPSTGEYEPTDADVYLEEMIIESETPKTDVGAAVRVHIAAGTSYNLFSVNGGSINTHGNLDLDMDNADDEAGGYVWEYDDTKLNYGDGGTQVSTAIADMADQKLFEVPAAGLTATVTIWLEGWQELRGSAIWDAEKDAEAEIHFGMKLYTPASTFLDDAA